VVLGAGTTVGRGLISDDLINQIRDQVDIADIVGHHVSLTKAGQNLKGLCPFHQDKNPSFTVSPSKQIFHCFACGAGGNVFTFLTRITGASFPEVVRDLGRKVGVEVQEAAGVSQQTVQLGRIEQVNQVAAAWFQQNLLEEKLGEPARRYLVERGIQDATIRRFGIGLASSEREGLIKALTKQGFTSGDLAAAGLVGSRDQAGDWQRKGAMGFFDKFRTRVMFPIVDLRKRVVGFGGRILGDGIPKYLNSPDTPLFKKGQTLYAFDQAREAIARTKTVIVVEGYFDAIAFHQAGTTYTVATLGTALTPEHVQLIRRFASRVVLLFDPDAAGVRAALRSLDLFVNSGLSVMVVSLPEGDDPDTFVRKHGVERFMALQDKAPSLLDFAVEHSLHHAVSGTLEARIRSVDEILRILQKGGHPIERDERIRRVAERLGLNQRALIERYPTLLTREKARVGSTTPASSVADRAKRHPEERDLVYLLLQGNLSPTDIRRLSPELFSMALYRRAIERAAQYVDLDGRVSVRRLLDDLLKDPECESLAAELSMQDRHFDDMAAHIRDCFDTVERKRREACLQGLITELKTAEHDKRDDDVHRLNMQINELRMRKAGVPSTGMKPAAKE
jgi:DNA primase